VTSAPRFLRIAASTVAALVVVIALTLTFEQVMPPQIASFLSAIVVGLVIVRLVKRKAPHRALRLFRRYLEARQRGADETGARALMLAGLTRDEDARRRLERELPWEGPSEKDRVVAGVARLLERQGKPLDAQGLGALYDRVRDRFSIPGWELLPREFVDLVFGRLDEREREQLDRLVVKYQIFRQKFFRAPSGLARDPLESATDFARLLHSMGNRLVTEEPGDAERAYRLSLRLRPDRNLAHAGLAVLLDRTGRQREAVQEARIGLEVLDDFAHRPVDEAPSTEDISPFRSPVQLREALLRVSRGEPPTSP
jgi:hypothetical protein